MYAIMNNELGDKEANRLTAQGLKNRTSGPESRNPIKGCRWSSSSQPDLESQFPCSFPWRWDCRATLPDILLANFLTHCPGEPFDGLFLCVREMKSWAALD